MPERSSRVMLKVLFLLSSPSHVPSMRNYNFFQRVHFLSRNTDLTILARKGVRFDASAAAEAKVVNSPWPGKAGLLAYACLLGVRGMGRGYDLVLSEPSIISLAGWMIKLFSGCRWVVDVWDIPIRCNMNSGRHVQLRCGAVRRLMKRAFRRADLFIMSILPDYEFRAFEIPGDKVMEFKNAVWLSDLPRPASSGGGGGFRIVCMRWLHTADMGLDVLAEAFVKLKKELPDLRLSVIGAIPADVEPQVAPLRGLDGVEFIEFMEHGKLLELIGESQACVIPFRDVPDLAQTYPIKVIEYMAMGKPVVASDIEGMSRLIRDGENGLLFRAGDADDLARKVRRLYREPALREAVGEKAKVVDEEFDCRVKNEKILEALSAVVRD